MKRVTSVDCHAEGALSNVTHGVHSSNIGQRSMIFFWTLARPRHLPCRIDRSVGGPDNYQPCPIKRDGGVATFDKFPATG